jgi:16S rRNA (adenine(1408)-N(1))-methyltransferase
MRVLVSKQIVEVDVGWLEPRLGGRRVLIDVGAGDGRYVYETARGDPAALYIGLDPDAAALSSYAFRAGRKPARGGIDNVIYVVAALEQLPDELAGVADTVRVNFPWAGLLRGVIRPEPDALAALRRLSRPDGRIEIVLTYDVEHDKAALEGEALPTLDERYIEETLRPAYRAAGIEVESARRLSRDEALAIPSTWGRRLLHGRPRSVFLIVASASGAPAGAG